MQHNLKNKFGIRKSRVFRNIFLTVYLLLALLILTKFIDANFACGQVKDSDDNMSSSWNKVDIYYKGYKNKSSCLISPSENKFCCDIESIIGRNWKVGDIIFSEVYNNESGHVAGPVSLSITGGGYDIFPEMQLEKVIKINNKINKLIISNDSNVFLDSSLREPYNNVKINLNYDEIFSCKDCKDINQNISGRFGLNKLKLSASYADRTFFEETEFILLNSYEIEKEFSCPTCNKDKIKNNRIVDVNITLFLPYEVNNLDFKEYVPVDFEIIDSSLGKVKSYSESHNVIHWNISGKETKINYRIKTPNANTLSSVRYLFVTELENYVLLEKNITVYKFFPIFTTLDKKSFLDIANLAYSRIFPDKPLVFYPHDENIVKIAIFPEKETKNALFNIRKQKPLNELDNAINYYNIDTNLDSDNINKLYIEFKVSKDFLKKKGYKDVSLFRYFNKTWTDKEAEIYLEDENFIYYMCYIEPTEIFAIAGYKESLFDLLMKLFK